MRFKLSDPLVVLLNGDDKSCFCCVMIAGSILVFKAQTITCVQTSAFCLDSNQREAKRIVKQSSNNFNFTNSSLRGIPAMQTAV